MKETIKFLSSMAPPILDGRKTHTRRVVRPQPNWVFLNENDHPDEFKPGCFVWYAPFPAGEHGDDVEWEGEYHDCPYGKPGDVKQAVDECGKVLANIEITGVRVERLQEISFEDWVKDFCPTYIEREKALKTFVGRDNQIKMMESFWDSISGKKYPWSSNPWVWVIEFKKA